MPCRILSQILKFSCLLLIPVSGLHAQYGQEWQVSQNYYEWGTIFYDINHNGSEELVKSLSNTVTLYDGALNWAAIWTVTAANHDELLLWDLCNCGSTDDSLIVFVATNFLTDLTTQVLGYHILGSSALWSTSDFPGYISTLQCKDTDGDNQTEIVFGANDYSSTSQSYTSKFYVLRCSSGAVEYQSPTFGGYMYGPYLGDIDGDNTVEILLNIYYADSTSTLHAYSYGGGNVTEKVVTPQDFSVYQNYPNPFNSSTNIPLHLIHSSEISVKIVNIQGQTVNLILNGHLSAGNHLLRWNGTDESGNPVASGMYFYELQIGNNRIRKPMVLLK
jgi:hypothetical protein